jgi:cell division protein FtsI (penicillin-binding protein 3)
MSPKDKKINWVSVRIALVALLFAAGTVGLLVRAYRLHVSDADLLTKRAEKQRTMVLQLEARRGMIFDRTGEQMAASLEVHSVYARPKKVSDKQFAAKTLAGILESDEKAILKRLQEDKAFVWLQRRVSPLVADKIKAADIDGIATETEFHRFYPLRDLAAHALGFAGMDSKGLEGLELSYDEDLRADPVPITAQRDALGRPVMFAAVGMDAKRRDVHLTLDRTIQYLVEKELQAAISEVRAKSGLAMVMNPDTGEILALAVRPTYNLNLFSKASADVRRNRAVADTFEPGSTFKVFLAAAALDLDRIIAGEKFECHNGVFRYNGSEIHDVIPHGKLTFDEVLVQSSNIGAVKISEKLSRSEFYRILTGFGFGNATGIDLPGERPGMLALPAKWSNLSKANIAFGQGIGVTAVQLCAGFSAAINGGLLYKPHIMKRVTNAMGETIRENNPLVVRRVIKASTSQRIVSTLRQVVQEGTGKAAGISGADVVGKTGTAQKADPSGGYSEEKYVASFIGAIMDSKPRLVILVLLDEPGVKKRTGGKIAAPVFSRIGASILGMCGGKPSDMGAMVASVDIPRPRVSDTERDMVVVKRGPREGEWVVPDFKGLDMRQAVDVCGRIKCDPSFHGSGLAVDQDPKPGTILKEGAAVSISFGGNAS